MFHQNRTCQNLCKFVKGIDRSLTLIKEKAMQHGIELSLNTKDVPGIIQADERKFKQVVYKLLSNAVKFTSEGGKINVQAEVVDG
jgi:signal transduction histidine kinase